MNSNPLVAFVAIYWAIIYWKSYFHEWQKNYILSAFWTFIFIIFYNNFHSLSDYSVFSSDFRYFIQVLWATLNQNFDRGRYTIFLVRDWLPVRVMDEWKILVCLFRWSCWRTSWGNDDKNRYFLQTSTILAAKLNSW